MRCGTCRRRSDTRRRGVPHHPATVREGVTGGGVEECLKETPLSGAAIIAAMRTFGVAVGLLALFLAIAMALPLPPIERSPVGR